MGMVFWGVLLAIVGLVLIFSNLLGFIPGVPILVLGIVLAVVGVVAWLASLPFKAGRRIGGRGST